MPSLLPRHNSAPASVSYAANFFVLRLPLRTAVAPMLGDFDTPSSPASVRKLLATDPILLPAIFLSSRTLYEAVRKWLESPSNGEDDVPAALMRYLLRARSRSTPFGLFALLACGRVTDTTLWSPIHHPDEVRLVHRLSYEAEAAGLIARRDTQAVRTFKRSPTLWRRGGEYLTLANIPARGEACALVTAHADEELNDLLAQYGKPVKLTQKHYAETADLVEAGMLVEQASHPALLESPRSQTVNKFAAHSSDDGIDYLRAPIASLDDLPIDAAGRIEQYVATEAAIRERLGNRAPSRPAIVVSAFSRAHGQASPPTLSNRIGNEAASIAANLASLFGEPNKALQQLKPAFAQHSSLESIPLLEFVYGKLGQDFEQLLSSPSLPSQRDYSRYDRYVLQHVLKALGEHQDEVNLSWNGIRSTLSPASSIVDHLASPVFSLVEWTCALGSRERILWKGMEVGTGTSLLSRFEASHPELHGHVHDWLQDHADLAPDIQAEVLYLPHPKLGDVLRRVARTSYAIFLSPSEDVLGLTPIELDTLHLRLSNGRLELWCSHLRKKIKPVLSVPHYYQGSMHPVYKLLCALGMQDLETAALRIPDAITGLSHCPRIVIDDAIFRLATWTLTLQPSTAPRRGIAWLRAHLHAQGVPQWFAWSQVDQSLEIDSSNDLELGAFLAATSDLTEVQVTEVLAPPPGLSRHEIVLPVRLRHSLPQSPVAAPPMPTFAKAMQFSPGSEYIYLQLFGTMAMVDRLPQELHNRLGKYLGRLRLAPFYTKYTDPSPHLRFRIHIGAEHSTWAVTRRVCACVEQLRSEGWLDRFLLAPYEPEIDRYGGSDRWQLSEYYFSADSKFARILSSHIEQACLEDEQVVFAMALSCLYVADDFGIPFQTIESILSTPRPLPHNSDAAAKQTAGVIFRQFQGEVTKIALGKKCSDIIRCLMRAADERTLETHGAREALLQSVEAEDGWRIALFRAHLHMSMNRIRRAGMANAEEIAYALAVRLVVACSARGLLALPRSVGHDAIQQQR